eukprot:SAG31_NODE_4738_length_2989_cov_1.405882_3_plen_45_part_00
MELAMPGAGDHSQFAFDQPALGYFFDQLCNLDLLNLVGLNLDLL